MNHHSEKSTEQQIEDANACLAMGAGLGVVGTSSALLLGATCPLCVVLTPALLGVGAWKRLTAGKSCQQTDGGDTSIEPAPTNETLG